MATGPIRVALADTVKTVIAWVVCGNGVVPICEAMAKNARTLAAPPGMVLKQVS